jgi:outer membrane protein OmpA-like peptidoglycan-associated protein
MNKRPDPVFVATIGVTVTLMATSLWLFSQSNQTLPGRGGIQQVENVNSQNVNSQNVNSQPLRILGDSFSGYSTFRSQAFQAALKDRGIQIQYADEMDQAKRSVQISQGKADLMVTTLDQYLKQQMDGKVANGKIVGLIDSTVGADAVVLNTKQYPSLKSLLDLARLAQQAKAQGKPLGIAFAGDTPSEYLALVLDTKFDAFNLADFAVTRVADASDAWKLMRDGRQNVAIAILWEPFVSQARQQGNSVVLSSKDVPGAIVDVLVASDRAMESRPQAISTFLEAYYRQMDANVQDASALQAQIAQDGKLNPVDAGAVIQGIDFFTATESQSWLRNGTLERRIGSTAAVLTLAGRMKEVPAQPKALFTDTFLAPAVANTQGLIDLVRADNPALADRLSGKARSVVAPLLASQVQDAPDVGNLKVQGEVGFATGSAQLNGQGAAVLQRLAQEIKEFNQQTIGVRVIGHTSKTGAADANQALSLARAQVVVDYLRGQGVQHNIVAEGKGFGQPLPNVAPAADQNQRTEIRLVRIESDI